ncbi:UbiA family prenyltransferase [Burkholderia guangdongensis]|uniref:UbiA family prenyltransferase n=1 Tax=Burkholderia guangdongensis TaxID=1792500 RepID=UPI001FE7F278|nr:UbiA family prenyltransferase [Burkholderia guangdongensis]
MMLETRDLPLVVDLDGTLLLTGALAESVVRAVRRNPLILLKLPVWRLKGRAAFGHALAARADLCVDTLPYREPLVDYLTVEQRRGRRIALATDAPHAIATRIAAHLGVFDAVLATEDGIALRGDEKLKRIRERFGDHFVYAGGRAADLPIWRAGGGAILAGASSTVSRAVRSSAFVEREFAGDTRSGALWLRALRARQWLKNLLLFVPLIATLTLFDAGRFASLLLAFSAMSLGASAAYIGNDLWDLDRDRRHSHKRERPFASGRLPIGAGIGAAMALLALSFALAFAVSAGFAAMLALYLAMASAYCWWLRPYVIVDVLVLSLLYALRIVAGGLAANVDVGEWLLAFSAFAFPSLALAKRCAELVALRQAGAYATPGRDYRVSDLEVLWPLGGATSIGAVIVFGLFIRSPDTQLAYALPDLLWFVALGFIYLFARLWIAAARDDLRDDPVAYLLGNRGSLLTLGAIVATAVIAHSATLD